MTDEPRPVRSYQRLFRPERRIYQIEGRPLPIPGGIPLRWLGYAVATLLAIIVLSSGSTTVAALTAAAAGLWGLVVGGRGAAMMAAGCGFVAVPVAGAALSLLDWPLRLLILPGLVATLGTQATPDGRLAHRYAASWLAVRVAGRRSLGRTLPALGRPHRIDGWLWVASDERDPRPRRCRVSGPATLHLRRPVRVRRRRVRRSQLVARPVTARRRLRRGEALVDALELSAGERVEVRP